MKWLFCVALAACGPEPKLSVVQKEVFSHSCTFSSCHASAYGEARLDLRPGKAYGALVNVPSQHEPSRLLVVPGDPDASYLMDKLYGQSVATDLPHEEHSDIMPPASTGTLGEEWKALVREWIRRGAKED